jgi:hypothetical protein
VFSHFSYNHYYVNDEDIGNRRMWLLYRGFDLDTEVPGETTEHQVLPVKLPMASVPIGIVTLRNRTLSPTVRIHRLRPRGR